MSEIPRKDFGDKAKEALTNDSSKSGLQQAKENVTDKLDNVAGDVQKETGDKSFVQQAKDKVSDLVGK